MKKIFTLLFFIGIAMSSAMAQRVKPSEFEAKVSLINSNKSGVTVRAIGYGNNEAKAREDAEFRTAKAILFVGLSQGGKLVAMVSPDKEETEFFKEFINSGKYRSYFSSVESSGTLDKVKGQKYKQMSFDITVNTKSLERALRQAGEIKDMGF